MTSIKTSLIPYPTNMITYLCTGRNIIKCRWYWHYCSILNDMIKLYPKNFLQTFLWKQNITTNTLNSVRSAEYHLFWKPIPSVFIGSITNVHNPSKEVKKRYSFSFKIQKKIRQHFYQWLSTLISAEQTNEKKKKNKVTLRIITFVSYKRQIIFSNVTLLIRLQLQLYLSRR